MKQINKEFVVLDHSTGRIVEALLNTPESKPIEAKGYADAIQKATNVLDNTELAVVLIRVTKG
jgi:hypothetical protein